MNDTKEIILKTAYNLFLYNNYEAVTINSIIKATGLTKGGIYYHFESKEDIFIAVVDKYMLENRCDDSVKYDSLKELIQDTVNTAMKKIAKHSIENKDFKDVVPVNYISLMFTAYRYYPGYAEKGTEFMKGQTTKWENTIREAIRREEIRSDIDIEATIANFLQIASGIISNLVIGGSMIYAIDMFERQHWELYKCIKKK